MRITLVSPFDPHPPVLPDGAGHVGGVERVFSDVSRTLARRGHDVTLICSTDGAKEEYVHEGVRVLREHRRGTLFRAPIASLADSIPSDADVVQVAATYPFTTPKVLRRAHRLGIPSVLDFHFEPHPGSWLARAAAMAYRSIGPRAYGLADAVLLRSYSYGRAAPSLARVPEDRWRILPNGIDPGRFHPDGANAAGDYLLFVGRLVPYKGVDVLFRALARSPVALPLVVAGEGPLRASLEALARRLEIDVRFLGRVSNAALPDLYRNARVTILPSVNRQEAFGISLLESMACGTPVVASDLPGVEELARQGGFVATAGDPQSLACEILRATGRGALPRGAELAARVHATYSWNSVTDRLLSVYGEILGRRRVAPAEVTKLAHPRGDPVL